MRTLTQKDIEILDEDRVNFYLESLPEHLLVGFFLCRNNVYMTNMIGKEFEYQVKLHLEKNKAKNIQSEVDIGCTSIDVVCELNNKLTTVEAKCTKNLKNNKCVKQIRAAKGHYKNCKVLVAVPKDTHVTNEIQKQIESEDGDILRIDKTKEEIVKELLRMQRLLH